MKSKKILMSILLIILVAIMPLFISGCNYQIVDLEYTYTNAYVKIGDDWKDLEIVKWRDYEDGEQLQLTLRNGTVILVSSMNCILYKGKLPKGE